jgi:hypothetical protein
MTRANSPGGHAHGLRARLSPVSDVRLGRVRSDVAVTLAAIVLVVAISSCSSPNARDDDPASAPPPSSTEEPEPTAVVDPQATTVLAAVDELAVRGRAPRTGYSRELFGAGWLDLDDDGCDTREEILRRDLTRVVFRPDDPGCTVETGLLRDPFSGNDIWYVKGSTARPGVDIDHVVALSDAWQKGAGRWDGGKRIAFANDPLNLLAVSSDLNQAKGDGDAATWLPPDRSFWCDYAARQVSVKYAYEVWVTKAEQDALLRILQPCPAAPLEPSPILAEFESAPDLAETVGADPRFSSCSEAKAYGLGPYQQGEDPEYGWYTDGDGDGVVCE